MRAKVRNNFVKRKNLCTFGGFLNLHIFVGILTIMAKDRVVYVCEQCGQESPKWVGKCPSCGEWNSFKELRVASSSPTPRPSHGEADAAKVFKLSDVSSIQDEVRIDMKDSELNRVLGGGMVVGSLVLLGGEPGIGKSTLLLQSVLRLSGVGVLYVSGEESASQLRMRAERVGGHQLSDEVSFVCETCLERVFEHIDRLHPDIVVIDSIQTIYSERVESSAGSVSQVRECAASLLRFCKSAGVGVFMIGHINKDGVLAGPKVLEHIVDAVIQFEGDGRYLYRVLRCIKNRFGSTSELGIYEMAQDGLRGVSNPSELLLNGVQGGLSGIAISCAVEGIRPFLLETQALVSSAAYGTPQRSATGFDSRRLNMLLAVLEKRVGFRLIQRDVFLNIAGGLRITDLAMDLGVSAAVHSSNTDLPIEEGWCMAGEVGLSGEVRSVSRIEQRISEAARLGFKHMIVPRYNLKGLKAAKYDIELHGVDKVEEALRILFG